VVTLTVSCAALPVEVRSPDELTLSSARGLADTVAAALREGPSELSLNLETVKVIDAVGLAVVAQAVTRADVRGTRCRILPSAEAYRALFAVGLLPQLPIDQRCIRESLGAMMVSEAATSPVLPADGPHVRLSPPTWDDLRLLAHWAQDDRLVENVGSDVLALGRHFGLGDPQFAAAVLGGPTSLLFLIVPLGSVTPVGFVRLYNINLAQRFAFLETVVVTPPGRRPAWGIEASQLVSRYAVDVLRLYRIETKVYADNVLPTNALRRHGFTLEGRLRQACARGVRRADILVFGILEPEIRAALPADIPAMTMWP
jgi:RimJ/RimL family protein N-acetyltransferase/anti-anti-sigma regulatory factor